jgi:starch-binding outer membrane protein, SusD/RagB family
MKRFNYIYLAILLVVLGSCKKSILDVTNPNVLTEATFWKTSADLQQGLTAVYSQFCRVGNWSRWMYFRYDLTSDEGASASPWVELQDWTKFQYTNYDFIQGGYIMYKEHYMQISYANQVIVYGAKITPTSSSDSLLIQKMIGQAKFIRAFDYFNLMIMFGRCEKVFDLSSASDKYEMLITDSINKYVIKDLTEAIALLPASWTGDDIGRVTKGAAYALLGKTYMQMHEWQKAKDAFDWLVTGDGSSYYGLMDNYVDNFQHYKENNKESVFEIQFSDANETVTDQDNTSNEEDDIASMSLSNTRSKFFGGSDYGWGDGNALPWIVDSFKREPTVDKSVNDTLIDDRLRISVIYPNIFKDFPTETLWAGAVTAWPTSSWGTTVWFRKYEDEYYKTAADYYSPINYRVIRYADVLLCYSECLANLGDLTGAVTYVNKIRQRPSTNLPPLAQSKTPYIAASAGNLELFLLELQTERALELYSESVRWIDLKRWGVLDTQEGVDAITKRDPDFSNFVVGKHSVMPLPSSEVNNNTNLKQNPNY